MVECFRDGEAWIGASLFRQPCPRLPHLVAQRCCLYGNVPALAKDINRRLESIRRRRIGYVALVSHSCLYKVRKAITAVPRQLPHGNTWKNDAIPYVGVCLV